MHILGISAFYHDSAACILSNGAIVAAAQEERFTRRKHDDRFPANAIAYCLKHAGIAIDDVACVAFYDKPWLKFERLIDTYSTFAPRGLRSFLISMPLWLKHKLWMGDLIKSELRFEKQLYFPEHHQSHAASAFFPSPFDRAAILTVDGVGEWATASWGAGRGNRIDLRSEMRFPHSLGLLYSAFTHYTGFRVNSGEYKVMGLAPYGEPKYSKVILDELIDLKADGSFRLNMKYFDYAVGLSMTSNAFHELFGRPPRESESPLSQRDMDLARSVQDVAEEVILRMARHVRSETGERALCLAGGVALNCVANGRLLRERIFDQVWIQPAAGDAGGALGAAAFVWHNVLGNPRYANGKDALNGAFLGPDYRASDVAAWAAQQGLPYESLGDKEAGAQAAAAIAEGKVVGWFSGRMEFGPRALGSRSILGDPRNPQMQSIMNLKIKFRESFRPFAPACLEEDAADYFELDCPSPYMMITAPVRKERRLKNSCSEGWGIDRLNQTRSDIPAVTHVDYSARVQTVSREDNPAFHHLLSEFKARTGCSVVINTSFNVRGEPIVCTPEDAYRCFMRTEMDVLFIEGVCFRKEQQPTYRDAAGQSGFPLD